MGEPLARARTQPAVVIGFAIDVLRHFGPGLIEMAYEECLCFELGTPALATGAVFGRS